MRLTVLQTVQKAAAEMGMPTPQVVVTATDTTTQQYLALFNAVGEELVKQFDWQSLIKEYTFTTTSAVDLYSLPVDFDRQLNQTQWSRTNHWPLMGPQTPEQWQTLKGGVMQSGPRTRYRIIQNQIKLHPVPAGGELIAFEYVSGNWVINGNNPNVTTSSVTTDGDKSMFDDRLMVDGLKLKFFEIKGFDTTVFRRNYEQQLALFEEQFNGAQVLSLSPRRAQYLIGNGNLPDGSYNAG